jgi:hypothetical protein
MARDCRSAWDPYFLWEEVALERLVALVRSDVWAQQQDAQRLAACPQGLPDGPWRAAPQAMRDELVLPPGKTALRQVLPPPVPQAQQRVLLEQPALPPEP